MSLLKESGLGSLLCNFRTVKGGVVSPVGQTP